MNLPPGRKTMRHHTKRGIRVMFLVLGTIFMVLGITGFLLPILPGTPFMLVAAACFARSSDRFHAWLLEHPLFGTTVREWHEHRSIPRKSRWTAIIMMTVSLTVSILFSCPDII